MSVNKHILMESMELLDDDVLEKAARGLEKGKRRRLMKTCVSLTAAAAAVTAACFAAVKFFGENGAGLEVKPPEAAASTAPAANAMDGDPEETEAYGNYGFREASGMTPREILEKINGLSADELEAAWGKPDGTVIKNNMPGEFVYRDGKSSVTVYFSGGKVSNAVKSVSRTDKAFIDRDSGGQTAPEAYTVECGPARGEIREDEFGLAAAEYSAMLVCRENEIVVDWQDSGEPVTAFTCGEVDHVGLADIDGDGWREICASVWDDDAAFGKKGVIYVYSVVGDELYKYLSSCDFISEYELSAVGEEMRFKGMDQNGGTIESGRLEMSQLMLISKGGMPVYQYSFEGFSAFDETFVDIPCEERTDGISEEDRLPEEQCVNIGGRCCTLVSGAAFIKYYDPDGEMLKSEYPALSYDDLYGLPFIGSGFVRAGYSLNDLRLETAEAPDSPEYGFYRLDDELVIMRDSFYIDLKKAGEPAFADVPEKDLIYYSVFRYDHSLTQLSAAARLLYGELNGENTAGIAGLKMVKLFSRHNINYFIEARMNDGADPEALYSLLEANGIGREFLRIQTAQENAEVSLILPLKGGQAADSYGNGGHKGVDIISAEGKGAAVLAAADGVVKTAEWRPQYGNYVLIDHGGFETAYAHCDELFVSAGQRVAQGEKIASVGTTGLTADARLHFEVLLNGENVDPADYIDIPAAPDIPAPPLPELETVPVFSGAGLVSAAADGFVKEARTEDAGDGLGKYLVIQHENGYETLYANCDALYVSGGDTVSQKDIIAAISSDAAPSDKLPRFELRLNGEAVDPAEAPDIFPPYRVTGLVRAAADGFVKEAREDQSGGLGRYIIIEHANGYETLYANCDELYITEGSAVSAGETIASTGGEGFSAKLRLRFEIIFSGVIQDSSTFPG